MNSKIMISVNTAWNVYNFRAGLIRALTSHGHQVVAVAPEDEYARRLPRLGCRFIDMPMDNNGTHPGRDLALLLRYIRLLRAERPAVYLGYTVKPNVYGSLAAHLLGIPVINNIAGLGTVFIRRSLLTRLVRELYRLSLRRSQRVFFQNADDQSMFIKNGLVPADASDRLPGSGMDLNRFRPTPPLPLEGRPFRFLLVARLLKDKGVEEFVEAARILKGRGLQTECQLLGFIDPHNANAISAQQIGQWESAGLTRYLGKADDVRPYMADADCIVLPSYREGVPRSLLEAAAMARPIVTTDTVGCRDIVQNGSNGLLCRVADATDLAAKMTDMLALDPARRLEMGRAGRLKVEAEFDERLVIQKYLHAIEAILRQNATGAKGRKAAFAMRGK